MIKRKLNFMILCIATFGLFACGGNTENSTTTEGADTTAKTEQVAEEPEVEEPKIPANLTGTYQGTLPCADCPGIKTSITINADGSFVSTREYLESDAELYKNNGMVNWVKEDSVFTLVSMVDTTRRSFKIGTNQLIMLDGEGKIIEGDLAEHYILNKQ